MRDPKVDDELLAALEASVANERVAIADVLERLGDVMKNDVALRKGYSSAFDLCVGRLGYSEKAAYKRVQAARAAMKFPEILADLRSGRLNLSAVVALAPHLKKDIGGSLLEQARGKTARELERLIAGIAPLAEPHDRIRTLRVLPNGDERVQFTFTGGGELRRGIEQARELLRNRIPDGRLEHVLYEAVQLLLDKHDPVRKAARNAARLMRAQLKAAASGQRTSQAQLPPPADATRRIPEAVKQEVWIRDGGRCAFVSEGKRCDATRFLEVDHILPFALGGRSDDPSNLRLLCRSHNQLMAKIAFGDAVVGGLNRPPPTRP